MVDLKKMDKYVYDILEMNLFMVIEFCNYKIFKLIVYDVMKVIFIFLGERKDLFEVKYILYFISRWLLWNSVFSIFSII